MHGQLTHHGGKLCIHEVEQHVHGWTQLEGEKRAVRASCTAALTPRHWHPLLLITPTDSPCLIYAQIQHLHTHTHQLIHSLLQSSEQQQSRNRGKSTPRRCCAAAGSTHQAMQCSPEGAIQELAHDQGQRAGQREHTINQQSHKGVCADCRVMHQEVRC